MEFNIQALPGRRAAGYRWYAVSSSAYVEQQTGQLRVVGYLRNVEQLIQDPGRSEERKPCTIPWWPLYNVKTGREMVTAALEGIWKPAREVRHHVSDGY